MKAIALTEGVFTIDANHHLEKYNPENNKNNHALVIGIHPFLVIMNNENILFDTGLGRMNDAGIPIIHENLLLQNLLATDISKVILSHLHHDHIKGIARYDDHLKCFQLNFPNAIYYIHKEDFYATIESPNTEIEIKNKLLFLQNETQALQFYEGNSGNITPEIAFLKTDAHCKNHCVFWVKENEVTFFYGADDAPQLFQMQRKILAKYDANPALSADFRKKWWLQGAKEKWTFLFYHDTQNPFHHF